VELFLEKEFEKKAFRGLDVELGCFVDDWLVFIVFQK